LIYGGDIGHAHNILAKKVNTVLKNGEGLSLKTEGGGNNKLPERACREIG
jgi:hypothetical protein